MVEYHSFSEALDALKRGARIKRAGWNGKDQFVELGTCISYRNSRGEIVNASHQAMGSAALVFNGNSGVQVGWCATQSDILGTDWIIMLPED